LYTPFRPNAIFRVRPAIPERSRLIIKIAIKRFERANHLNPADDGYLFNLAWLHALGGDWRHARLLFEETLTLRNTAPYRIGLGFSLERDGRTDGALECYAEAVAIKPTVLESQFVHDLQERRPGAASFIARRASVILDDQYARRHSPIVLGKMGELDMLSGHRNAARDAIKQAVHELPSLSAAWANLGAIAQEEGDTATAELDLKRATLLSVYLPVAWFRLGRLLEAKREKDAAVECYEQAVRQSGVRYSDHARRVEVMYSTPFVVKDDVIPSGFLDYCSPPQVTQPALDRLLALYRSRGDFTRMHEMELRVARIQRGSL
jgi:tetratricopeptide (TPR) repeat protein